jgi:hypothetical protein
MTYDAPVTPHASRQESSTTRVDVGQVWRDNYDNGEGARVRFRHVKVVRVGRETAFIQRCEADGSPTPRSPITETNLARFNGKRGGFTLVSPAAVHTAP